MIEEAAYYRAQRRGCAGGDPVADWLEAEAEIDGLLAKTGESEQREPGEQLESQLRAFDAEIKRLLGKARRARAEARGDLERELVKLRPLRASAETKLSELRERSGEAWEEVRKGADRTREELSTALASIVKRWR
jgi:hypothetical protein